MYSEWTHSALHYTTLHFIQHYTTLHYTTLHYTTLHYTTLHYTTKNYITLHYTSYNTTLHYTTPHYTTLQKTTLHYTTLHNTTQHYNTLHCTWRAISASRRSVRASGACAAGVALMLVSRGYGDGGSCGSEPMLASKGDENSGQHSVSWRENNVCGMSVPPEG
jgi:hypothetical protein